jgi:hypothetical protein
MWEIIRDQSSITDEELVEKITEIDLRDGVVDGKMGVRLFLAANVGTS